METENNQKQSMYFRYRFSAAIIETKFYTFHMTCMTVHRSSILKWKRSALFEQKLFCLLPIDSFLSKPKLKRNKIKLEAYKLKKLKFVF